MNVSEWLFGVNPDKLVDGISKGTDKLVFTEQEKKEFNKSLMDWVLKYMEATAPQRVTRRIIASVVVGLWAIMSIASVALYKYDLAYSHFIMTFMKENVNTPFSIIMGFYFLSNVVDRFKAGK